ncbi:MAG TPA: hypothetical protein EYO33_09050, partial [Phycisphaerales bacterium]|nr:hypothetical protein [Phycisphaerales bacterium]
MWRRSNRSWKRSAELAWIRIWTRNSPVRNDLSPLFLIVFSAAKRRFRPFLHPSRSRSRRKSHPPNPNPNSRGREDFLAELESDVSEPEPLVGPTGTIRVNEEKVAAEIFQEQESPSRPLLRHPTDAPPITAHKSGGKRPRSQPKSEEKKATQKKKPGKRFSRYKLALFTRQMAVMLKAGIQLHQSVAFAADSDPEMEPLLKQVLQKLESGYSFSNAIADPS